MSYHLHRVSFSFTAVAKLAVPPGKWFCLARTGLGFGQYSCCVCGLHHDTFSKYWVASAQGHTGWRKRLETAIENSLVELEYGKNREASDVIIIRDRILEMVRNKGNYFVSQAFVDYQAKYPPYTFGILTDGPSCLVNLVFPEIPSESLHLSKSNSSVESISKFSLVHVGTNESDVKYVPQTRFLISRKKFENLPANIRVFPRLTPEVMKTIIEES